jgi:hypothetical protein
MFVSFSVENFVTIGLMFVVWMLLFHFGGQAFQYAQGN